MRTNDLTQDFFKTVDDWLSSYQLDVKLSEVGNVVSVGDGIAWISGLPTATLDEIMVFEDGSIGIVFELTEDLIGAVLLHETATLTAGNCVYRSNHTIDIPVGDALLGRVVDPLGMPVDGGTAAATTDRYALENLSPPIVARDYVQQPL